MSSSARVKEKTGMNMGKSKSIFPDEFDNLQSDFARASLELPLPKNLSKQINRNRWALYVSSLHLKQLIDEFAVGLDTLNAELNNAPYVFDFSKKTEGKRAQIYSYILASEKMAQEICQRLRIDGAYGEMRPAMRMAKACLGLTEFDNDEDRTRDAWVDRYAKANLLMQNTSAIILQNRLSNDDKLFKKMAYFIS